MDPLEHAPCRIFCPIERYKKALYCEEETKTKIDGQIYFIIDSSYYIFDEEDDKSEHILSILCSDNKEGNENPFVCMVCYTTITSTPYYYLCNKCNVHYHHECVESPSLFQCSDHPKHPLQLLKFSEGIKFQRKCCSCVANHGHMFYYCFICDFLIHVICAKNPTPLTIDNQKRHKHTLLYFPRKSVIVCDVCALDDINMGYLYACLQCDFFVHKRCVNLPYVIKVSRHNHRLAFTPNLPYKELIICGVCHTKINENYGEYSCTTKGCAYGVHSKCAIRRDVWDGKELQGEPDDAYENIKPFEEISNGIIQHFSHPHHLMRLDEDIERMYDMMNKHCQVCILPLYDGKAFRCMSCDYFLHESCAYLPRVKQNMLHAHPLILEPSDTTCWSSCRQCKSYSCGFQYVCHAKWCYFKLDTHCASISEPFDYHSHSHSLFLTYEQTIVKICSICRSMATQPLNCLKCDFVLCFHCAIIPYKVKYEHDKHLLTFSIEEEVSGLFWCEICEKATNLRNGLYTCNECGVTLHIECLLGRDPFMTPGQSRTSTKGTIDILPNTRSTRSICNACERYCPYKIMIKVSWKGIFCSFACLFELPKIK